MIASQRLGLFGSLCCSSRSGLCAARSGKAQKLVFSGTPEVAVSALGNILEAAEGPDAAFELHAVVSQPGRSSGGGSPNPARST